jgi:hypothetical protein
MHAHRPDRSRVAGPAIILTLALSSLLAACAPGATASVDATVRLGMEVTPVFSGVIYVVQIPTARPSSGITVRRHDGRSFHIPPGHYPPPGQCRVWHPDRPPGRQPPPGPCSQQERRVPANAYLIRG